MAEKPHEMLPRGGSLCSRVHHKETQDLQLTMCDVTFEFVSKMGGGFTNMITKQQPRVPSLRVLGAHQPSLHC